MKNKNKKEYLDRNNVGKAIDNLIKDQAVTSDGDSVYLDEVEWYMFIQEICQLKPKNQIVIAEGIIDYKGTELIGTIGKDFIDVVMSKNNGKKVKIIIEEI